jgi:predicted Zn-dependent protease
MNKTVALLLPGLMLGALVLFVACGAVPDTDRKQINFIDPDDEARLGIAEFQKIKQQLRISRNPRYNAMVQVVGARLARVIPVKNAQWEFVVFENPSPNAFALPGGKVGVNTGLFRISRNEAGLAAVIGHEVAHVVARHSGERLSRGVLSAGAVAAGAYLLNKKPEGDPKATAAALSGVAARNYKAHSREQELEADKLGALYMARAGYNPYESVRLWERFAAHRDQMGQSTDFNLLSTHPVDAIRIAKLKEYMPQAAREYRPL